MKPFRLLTYIIMCALVAGCSHHDDEPVLPRKEGRRTVLIYQCAQNSLGYYNYHRQDSLELMDGLRYLDKSDRLLVFTDDGKGAPRLYRYMAGKKEPQLLRTWDGPVDASDPAVLQEVLTWTREHFPAAEYGLVLWSHADGWLPSTNTDYAAVRPRSFGVDVGPGGSMASDRDANGRLGTQMDISAMAEAIAGSGLHAKYIFFDACMMQTLEVAYELRRVTDYIVASPIATPVSGAFYTHMLRSGLFSDDPADIARTFYADVVEDAAVAPRYGGYGLVVSCLKTEGMESLAEATRQVLPFASLMGHTSPDMSGVQSYYPYVSSYFYRPHAYDAQDAMRCLLPEAQYNAWCEALSRVVVYKAASSQVWVGPSSFTYYTVDAAHTCGVSMFVPQARYADNAANCAFGDHNENFRHTAWYAACDFAQTGW
ncbi:MAG: hypothetical protein IJ659_01720 [Alloprevotella sp.]|nr:hypothetical protein [Alloprevotella sp.]